MAAALLILSAAPLCLCLLVSAEEQRTITVKPGHDVTLPCRAGDGRNIDVVEWNRPDLEPQYVLLYRHKQFDPSYQHPSFQKRVDLQDREMKDGDVSLILKKVTADDTGTYECRVFQRGPNRRKRANLDSDPISIIHLEVSPSECSDTNGGTNRRKRAADPSCNNLEVSPSDHGRLGLIVVLVVIVVLSVVMVGVGVGVWIKRKEVQNLHCTKTSSQRVSSASDDQEDQERSLSLMPFSDQ